MTTETLHNLATSQATPVAATCPQVRSYRRSGISMPSMPWSNEIFVEGAAFARGSKDPQEALL